MNDSLTKSAIHDFTKSGHHDLLAPLWRHCESGGFPSEKSPAQWNFENGVIAGSSIHLQFRVHFTEESPGCCEDTPSLRPLSKTVYITRCVESGKFETYTDASIPAPDWSAIFGPSDSPPSYEDSFS